MKTPLACFSFNAGLLTQRPCAKRIRTTFRFCAAATRGRLASSLRPPAGDEGLQSGTRVSTAPLLLAPGASAAGSTAGGGCAAAEPALHPLLLAGNRVIVEGAVAVLGALYNRAANPWRRLWVLEVVARVPYFTFLCVNHLAETLGLGSETVTARLRAHFAEADNEALHLAVMEALGGGEVWVDRFVAQHVSLAYFWVGAAAYLLSPALAYHFNELVEKHACATYDALLADRARTLRETDPVPLVAHEYYVAQRGPARRIETMYDVIEAIRDDEAGHATDLNRYSRESIGSVPWRL